MQESSLSYPYRDVRPVTPPAAYIGGKRNLAAEIVGRIEAVPHESYCEPFVGMGGVFLKRRLAPRSEIINDLSGDVVTLFRILQRHYGAFMDHMRFALASRQEFERLLAVDPATLTDLERAGRFLYLQRLTFGGKVTGRTFGVSAGLPSRFNLNRLGAILEEIHERLAGVIIERLPWQDCLARYDTPGTLFYLDPPYWGSEHYYGRDAFERSDYEAMAAALAALKGRFMLSLNDTPGVREVFAAFAIDSVETTWSAARAAARRVREVIIGPRR